MIGNASQKPFLYPLLTKFIRQPKVPSLHLLSWNLHLNEDIIFVEKQYLDGRRFYPVITDFKRTSQPVYRYQLNDIFG